MPGTIQTPFAPLPSQTPHYADRSANCDHLRVATGTPGFPMTISRSPSPAPGGGWSSPGLNLNTSGRSSPTTAFPGSNGGLWESSRNGSNGGRGYPAFETRNQGFFQRHMRRISSSLPRFNSNIHQAEKEKLQKGQWTPSQSNTFWGKLRSIVGRVGRKSKLRLLLALLLVVGIWLLYLSRRSYSYLWA